MNKNIQKVFDDIHGEFTSYQSAVASALSARGRQSASPNSRAAEGRPQPF